MSLRLEFLGTRSPEIAAALTLALVVGPATPGFASGPLALVQPSEADMSIARTEYQKGEKAYRLGQFEEAALAFERAYEKSGLPDILYNIGLSHLRWYDVDPDIAHLRKAKVVFENYVIEIQKNPELGDREEAETLIKQIDEKIAAHEAAATDGPGDDQAPEPVDHGPDPGKKQRLGGAIAMGLGGALVVAGVVSGVVLGVRGQEFEENLGHLYEDRDRLDCTADDPPSECDAIFENIELYRNNGRTANNLAVGLGLTFGGLGLIGIVTGAVLFVQGNKKTQRWEALQISVVPRLGRDGAGLSISGRF